MRIGKSFIVSPTDRQRLMAVVKDRNAPQQHEQCANDVGDCPLLVLSDPSHSLGLGPLSVLKRPSSEGSRHFG
jgi:hypothetical protein